MPAKRRTPDACAPPSGRPGKRGPANLPVAGPDSLGRCRPPPCYDEPYSTEGNILKERRPTFGASCL